MSILQVKCPHTTLCRYVHIEAENPDTGLSIKVETERLKILSVNSTQYADSLVKLYGDKDVNALVGNGSTLSEEDTHQKIQRWIERWQKQNPLSGYVVITQSGKFVGQIVLKPVKDKSGPELTFLPNTIEIGYLSKKKRWGNGYGKEFTHAIIHHLVPFLIQMGYKVEDQPITTIIATARPDNSASCHILETFMHFMGKAFRYNGPRMWYQHTYLQEQQS